MAEGGRNARPVRGECPLKTEDITVTKRPPVREDMDCVWCMRADVRVVEFFEGDLESGPVWLCIDCMRLGLEAMEDHR